MREANGSPKVAISDWNLDGINAAVDLFRRYFTETMNEAIQIAMKENGAIYFPAMGTAEKGVDPDKLHIELPLGNDEYELPFWEASLSAEIDFSLKHAEPGAYENIGRVRDHLRKQADKIDNFLKQNAQKAGGHDASR